MQNVGPSIPRQTLTISAIADLPKGFQLSFISTYAGRQPFQPIITGVDFFGTGVEEFLLPGSGTNQFNFGLGKSDLSRLVESPGKPMVRVRYDLKPVRGPSLGDLVAAAVR